MGNRGGVLHSDDQRIVRTQKTRSWIICLTEYKGRKRKLMQPGLYTELFFLDEVTALAAGHRPCFECRRKDALAFAEAIGRGWSEGRPTAPTMDHLLDVERRRKADDPSRLLAASAVAALPDGTMIRQGDGFHAVRGGKLLPWCFDGYDAPVGYDTLTPDPIYLATPPSTVAALRQGYLPAFHSRAWKPAT